MLLIVLVVAGVGAFAYASTPVPTMKEDALVATTTVYYSDGTTVMGELNNGIDRKPLTEEQMPQAAKDAAVASEDRTFYENKGVSVTGIGRAVWGVITGNSDLGGGSTITQQYVKNITGNDQRAYARKATEAVQALKVDQKYSKDQILTSYLNTVYFGRGAYGIGAATEAYFGPDVDPTQLTHEQAALLIGILPAPSAWDPATDTGGNAQKRYTYVMGAMQGMGTVSAAEVAANPTAPVTVEQQKPQWLSGPNGYILNAVVAEIANLGKSQNFTVGTLDGGSQTLTTADQVQTAGLTVVTTIDKSLQDSAVATMADKSAYPTQGRPDTVRAGLVSIDPATGGVRAMYAGEDPQTQYDSVTKGSAQAGSTFKPFTLLAALESGDYTLSSTFNGSSPQTIDGYTVKNYGRGSGEQFGSINLLKATADSVNTVYVRLNEEVGPDKTADVAARLGAPVADNETDLLSNVLGTSTVRPIQMAQAYAALANGGEVRTAHFVKSIDQGDVDRFVEDTRPTATFDPQAVADTVYAMQAVTKTGGTAASVGSAFGKRPIAGKTGTTNDSYAAWFNGFTPQLQTAVVLYNSGEDGSQLPLGSWGGVRSDITGGTIPAKIWTSYMTKALKGTDVVQFPKPSKQVSSEPSPTATATPTPTDTASASPTDDPSASPSESPTDGETGATDGPTEDTGDTPQAAGAPQIADRAAARVGAAAQAAQGGPGQGRGAGGPAAGPGAGRAQG